MRTILSNNALHRLRHIVAEQANDAQAGGQTDYLHLDRLDAQDVADALEELVALRTQEEDAARHEAEKAAIIDARKEEAGEALDDFAGALDRLFEAVEG